MARKHVVVLALALGLAAAVGAVAAAKTARLGQAQATSSQTVSQRAALQQRSRLLDRQEIALRRALAKQPPRLPKRLPDWWLRVNDTPSAAVGQNAEREFHTSARAWRNCASAWARF